MHRHMGTGESTLVLDSSVPLIHHDPDRSWIPDPDPDHPKETQPKTQSAACIDIRLLSNRNSLNVPS